MSNKQKSIVLQQTLADGLMKILQKAKDNEQAVVGGEIDPITNDFSLITHGGEKIPVGKVGAKGEPGTDGISIVDVQLFEDPTQNNDVFFTIELSSGLVLQTRDSISGYHGKSVESVRQENNQLYFTLEGGVELEPIPVSGLMPVSVNGVRITAEKELIFQLDNGDEISAGITDDLKGRGVTEVYRQGGNLYIKYDDDPNTPVQLGKLIGIDTITWNEGNLSIQKDDGTETDLGPIVSFTGARVEGNELIIETNQPVSTGNHEFNLGQVQNLRGDDGLSIKTFDIRDNVIYVTLSDDSELAPVAATGLYPIHVLGARYDTDENEMYLILSDGNEISTGMNVDLKGVGIQSIGYDKSTGELSIQYDDGSSPVVAGTIPTPLEFAVTPEGNVTCKWSDDPENPTVIGQIISVDDIQRDSETGEVTAIMSNETTKSMGFMRSIESVERVDDNIIVTITGQPPKDLGSFKGDDGAEGDGVVDAKLDERGHLMLHMKFKADPIDAGYARTTFQNLLGQTQEFTWSEGPSFPIQHEGNVIVFVGNDVIPKSDYKTDVEDVVTYTGSATYDPTALVQIVSFVMAAPSDTGRGVFGVENTSEHVWEITLEDGTKYPINTETLFDTSLIPAGVTGGRVDQETNQLILTLDDGQELTISGKVNNSNNVKNAYVDNDGILQIELDSGLLIPAGSVISNITIEYVEINPDGDLLVKITGASEPFNAGPTANYVTNAYVDTDDVLYIETSDGRSISAGTVRNPVRGTIYQFVMQEGQTDVNLAHGEYKASAELQGVGLTDEQLDLTDPNVFKLKTPVTKANQILRITLYSKETFKVSGLESELTAPNDTFYGKDADGNVGWHPNHTKVAAQPVEILAWNDGDTEVWCRVSDQFDVYKNGSLMHEGVATNEDNTKLVFTDPLSVDDKLRVLDYSRPQVANGLLAANYAKIGYQTFQAGGTFTADGWRVRNINFVEQNQIGVRVENNRIIIPPGNYYVRGYAACKGVGQNMLQLYDDTNSIELLEGGAMFAPLNSGRYWEQPDVQTPITGYFTVESLASILLRHWGSVTMGGYGFGSGNTAGGKSGQWTPFRRPGRLVELEIWRLPD